MKPSNLKPKLLLFGGTGSIGRSIQNKFIEKGWDVFIVSRSSIEDDKYIKWNPIKEDELSSDILKYFKKIGKFSAVCWSQGSNFNDSVYDYNPIAHQEMYETNVMYILNSLSILIRHNLVAKPTRFCVVSSIWQNISRQDKLSYAVTKSALKGLVLSLSNDLGRDGHLFNAVLPGVIETSITSLNLSDEQKMQIKGATQFDRLATLEDVSNAVYSMNSFLNTGITGNFTIVDLGFSRVKNI